MNKRQKRLRSVVFISCIFTFLYVLTFSGCANIKCIATELFITSDWNTINKMRSATILVGKLMRYELNLYC